MFDSTYPTLPLDRTCSRCGHCLTRWKGSKSPRGDLWKCIDGCETIYSLSLEEKVRRHALKQAGVFSSKRERDKQRLPLLQKAFERDIEHFRSNPTNKDAQRLEREANKLYRLRRKVTLSPIKSVMTEFQDPGPGRPRKSTVDKELSAAITVSYDVGRLTQAEILRAMGYSTARHYYTRLSQYLTAGRLALATGAKRHPEHRALQREVKSLTSSKRQMLCKRLLHRLGPNFLGRVHQPTSG